MIKHSTIGNKRCEIALNQMLIEANDDKITSSVLRRFHRLKQEFLKIKDIKNKDFEFYKKLSLLIFKDLVENFDKENKLPKIIKTTALCCYRALYRETIKK
jgi:hypothetical protein